MKNYILFILGFPICLNAQNWSPLNMQDKYNYQIESANYISNTLWVDSAGVVNGDSVFHLNRIVEDCPVCDSIAGNPGMFKIANRGQFLQKKMIKKPNGVYCFEGENKFYLNTNATISDSWIYDSIQNIQATIIDVLEQEVFGSLDSVKTVLLSSSDTIIFSKNFGILQFRESGANYSIRGIEGRDLGELVPDFWDFYNFDIGDVFQHEEWEKEVGSGNFPTTNITAKIEILGKEIIDQSITYNVHEIVFRTYSTNGYYEENSWNSVHDISFQDNIDNFPGTFNKSLISDPTGGDLCGSDPLWLVRNYINIYRDTMDQKIVKDMGDNNYNINQYEFPPSYLFINESLDTLKFEDCLGVFYEKYKEGLGQVYLADYRFEYGHRKKLVGYIKGGDTTGIITPDEDLLIAIKTPEPLNINLTIQPNPSDGKFTIDYVSEEALIFEVIDINGQVVFKAQKSPSANQLKINIPDQPAGIYFLKVSSGNALQAFKLVKG